MSRLQMSIDGSSIKMRDGEGRRKKDLACLGWGIIAHAPGYSSEIFGATVVPKELGAYHEYVAFVEACMYAHNRGFSPHETFIQTDEFMLEEAKTALHEVNMLGRKAERITDYVHTMCSKLYTPRVEGIVLDFMRHARIEKILGHGRAGHVFVEHARADYLAKKAAQNKIGINDKPPIAYSEWLRSGLGIFDVHTRSLEAIRLPFVDTPGLDELLSASDPEEISSDLAPEAEPVLDQAPSVV